MRRLATSQSPRANFLLLFSTVTLGLFGSALLIPWWGVGFFMLLSLSMRLLMFLQSHYLNQLVDSKHRATVLSFRGLAVNISYGFMSIAFAVAVTATCFNHILRHSVWERRSKRTDGLNAPLTANAAQSL